MTLPLLEVEALRIALPLARGEVVPVRGVDFALDRGATLGLIGESGSGKSLTALALLGLLPEGATVSGRLALEGQDLLALDERGWCALRGRRIAMVFQEPMTALNPLHRIWRQVAEPLVLHLGLDRAAARTEALRLLDRVGIAAARADAYPHELSGGQRQRVAIAMALACGPALLIADEPTTALDAHLRRQVLALLAELVAERGMGLLLISHDLTLMARHVERLMVMYAGRIAEAGPTAAVLERPAHPYTQGLLAARPRLGGARVGDHRSALPTLPGAPPDPAALPSGCAFRPRCPRAAEVCAQDPTPVAVGDLHSARCLRVGAAGETPHG